jgi:hypothetical protein
MDRREALKRLGVGGALAVTAPLLLDSFNVAHAVSGVVEEPPPGTEVLMAWPPTTKTNQLEIRFNPSAFGDRDVVFYWSKLAEIPAITLEVDTADSSIARVKKATGQGNVNYFMIQVDVYEAVVVYERTDMVFIAQYLVISEGGLLTVTLQS